MKNILIIIILFWGFTGLSQVTQKSATQSLGARINEVGAYRAVSIVGQSASNGGTFSNSGFSGSIGFLTFEENTNTAPIADAGEDILIEEGKPVTLDGGSSFDPQNDPLLFKWESLDGLTLSDVTIERPTLIAPDVVARRKFRFVLTVSDGDLDSSPDTTTIIVSDPGWIPAVYTNSSTLYAVVTLEGIPAEQNDYVAARVSGECRGVAEIFFFEGQAFVVFNIQSETVEPIIFEVYDQSKDETCPAGVEVTTNPGGDIGSPSSPIPIDGNCTSVSILDAEALIDLKLIPNPTSGIFQLFASFEKKTKGTLKVYNIGQQLLYAEDFDAQHLEEIIDISIFPNGLYLLIIQTQEHWIAKKIEKVGE